MDSDTYVCNTKVGRDREKCGVVVKPGERHEHGCPMEEDMCGARGCNESGMCQA